MKIAIIGAGFTGLTSALDLLAAGHEVTIFESESQPGGLANGFRDPHWDWQLEKHYHHLFSSDSAIRDLAAQLNFPIKYSRPVTATLINGRIYQLDSPGTVLSFPLIPFLDRVRMGAVIAYIKAFPWWRPFEKISARDFLSQFMGQPAWKTVWEPLFVGKFDKHLGEISAAWFWSRIKARSMNLGYPQGGFQTLADAVADNVIFRGGRVHYSTPIKKITSAGKLLRVTAGTHTLVFDKVISTLTTPAFIKTVPGLSPEYLARLKPLSGMGAVNLVLSLKHSFLDKTYWLNINEPDIPFLALVEHTNFVDPVHYAGDKILYVGKYLDQNHPYFSKTADELIKIYTPALKKINSRFSTSWIKKSWVWKTSFAQPIMPLNYSRFIPPFNTSIPHLYLANMQQVYPWDRGTNFAVELGHKVVKHVLTD